MVIMPAACMYVYIHICGSSDPTLQDLQQLDDRSMTPGWYSDPYTVFACICSNVVSTLGGCHSMHLVIGDALCNRHAYGAVVPGPAAKDVSMLRCQVHPVWDLLKTSQWTDNDYVEQSKATLWF